MLRLRVLLVGLLLSLSLCTGASHSAAAAPLARRGFVVARGVLSIDEVDRLRAVHASIRSPRVAAWMGQDIPWDALWTEHDELWDLWRFSPVAALVARATGAARVSLLTDFFVHFQPSHRPYVVGQWHVDTTSFDIVDTPAAGVSVWIPLQDVDPAGAGGSLYTVNKTSPISPMCSVSHNGMFSPACDTEFWRYRNVHSWRKGDMLLFTARTVHRSQPIAGGARTALVGRFLLDAPRFRGVSLDTRTVQRKNLCNHGLRSGDPVNSSCFPQLYPWVPPMHRYRRRTRRTRVPSAWSWLWANLWWSVAA